MASNSLRSSRKTEGLSTRSSKRNTVLTHPNTDISHTTQQLSNIGRKKRRRESDEGLEPIISNKKAKIAVEILSQPKPLPKTRSLVIKSSAIPDAVLQRSATPPPKQPLKATKPEPAPPPKKLTNHREKVVNGIKHELDRLGPIPNEVDIKDEKRKLRSQEGTRFKSELSAYFPEYDEVIGNEPREDHILNLDTPIIIVDSAKLSTKRPPSSPEQQYPLKEFPDSLFDDLYDAQRVDFSFLDPHFDNDEAEEDALSEDHFVQIHKKPERHEKTIRNTDKGRAQHEKDQVIRLLEGLQGHDWLKLMGVSGITETKKKDYEPARDHFIKGCEAILEKFRAWREEEKRRKVAKEEAMARASAEAEEGEEEEEGREDDMDEEDDGNVSDGDPPDYSDVDASAARQLHDEAIARSAPLRSSKIATAKVALASPAAFPMERDFTSFFSKPYLREAALGKHRRSGRSVAAWGHPVPEVPETNFDLPEELRDEETLKSHARKKRRIRRVSKD